MDDDLFEEKESIFGQDEVFDCMMLDEIEKEKSKKKGTGTGCLTTIFLSISTIGGLVVVFFMFI